MSSPSTPGSPLRAEEYATYGAVLDLQPVTPTELARHLSLPTTTALDAVRAMVDAGHAHRLRNPRDQRSYLLELTDAGRAAHGDAGRFFARADDRLLERLGPQRDAISQALLVLAAASREVLEDLREEAEDWAG